MPNTLLEHLSRGVFSFLEPEPEEIRSVIPAVETMLPEPQQIFLRNETATPLIGFPVLQSRQLRRLEEALVDYLEMEEEVQLSFQNRDTFDSKLYAQLWERYRSIFTRMTENVTVSSYGQNYPGVLWLYHSHQIARRIKEVPKRLLRRDLTTGREHGDALKYKVLFKFIDRVVTLTYDVVHRIAAEIEEEEDALFPSILAFMRDNVLILTEDYVSPDLTELNSYFHGHLGLDGRDFRQRLGRLEEWHEKNLRTDPVMRSAVANLLHREVDSDERSLFHRPGYLSFLSSHVTYSPARFLTPEQVQVWESLLTKLKEFEVLHALRKMVVPLDREDGELVSRDRSTNTTWVGGPPVLHVSEATRPIDFTASWVVDPLVQRYGLVYDITDFSAIITMLGRAEKAALDNAFRTMFRFQRRINQMATSLRLKLEKYLGDGAFYSARSGRNMLQAAVYVQRTYSRFLEQGFPFDRGLRIALNYSEYRILPLERGPTGRSARYEFFGHGLVELSRLVTGKATQEIDELKTYLLAHGYPEPTLNKFFAPMLRRNTERISKKDKARRFFAYIDPNGTLINEGIVATEPFIGRLGRFEDMYYARLQGRGYIVLPLDEDVDGRQLIAIRKLGYGKFKGLDETPIYEVVDAAGWDRAKFKTIPPQALQSALERVFAVALAARYKTDDRPAGPTDISSP